MTQRMAAEFSPRIEYEIVSTRYPAPHAEWDRMTFREKLDEKLLGGSSIRNVVDKFVPDLVYSDSPQYATQFKLLSLLSRKRVPLVLHLRGDVWREHWAAFASASTARRILSIQQHSYDWTSVALSTTVTPICRWLQTVITHHIPRKRCEVVYQGIDPKQFDPEVQKQPTFEVQKPAIAILQNHSVFPKVQGLINFRKAVEKLPRVHFYIAEGEAWAQSFLSVVKEHYARVSNVHFVKGITSADEVSRMITACDCYVLASGLDCCPTTVLEASLLQKPVLASRVGGVPEIIEDGVTGWSVDNEDINSWVSRIETILQDPRLSRRLGSQGRQWVSEKFGWETIAPQVERLIIREAER